VDAARSALEGGGGFPASASHAAAVMLPVMGASQQAISGVDTSETPETEIEAPSAHPELLGFIYGEVSVLRAGQVVLGRLETEQSSLHTAADGQAGSGASESKSAADGEGEDADKGEREREGGGEGGGEGEAVTVLRLEFEAAGPREDEGDGLARMLGAEFVDPDG